MINPEVAQRGLARAGLKTSDRSFVDLEVIRISKACGEDLMKRQQHVGKVVVPVAHEVAGHLDAVGGLEFPLLAVKRAVIAKLLCEQVSAKRRGEDGSGK